MTFKRSGYLVCFFVSGFTALLYQIIWVRQLQTLVGGSTLAATAVISSFMGGLALGAALASYLIAKIRFPAAVYAVAQLIIGVFALFFPYLLETAKPVISMFYGGPTGSYALAVFITGFLLLLIPTTFMGSTFSLMVKILDPLKSRHDAVAQAYAVNTLGAATGAFVTGFFLLRWLGIFLTSTTGVALNLLLAITLWLMHQKDSDKNPERLESDELQIPEAPKDQPELQMDDKCIINDGLREGNASVLKYFIATFLLGFSGMAYEILIFRYSMYFLPFIYNNIYLVPTVVFAFCLWIGTGSHMAAKVNEADQQRFLSIALFSLGLYVVFSGHTFLYFDFFNQLIFTNHIWNLFIKANILLFIPAFLSGFCFPLLCRCVMGKLPVKSAAVFYSFNTVGCILGPLAATFLIVPTFGVERSFILVGSLPICVMLLVEKFRPALITLVFSAVLLILLMAPPGPGFLPEEGYELVAYQEDRDATTIITRDQKGQLVLTINDHEAAGTDYVHYRNQIMMALVPMALHPSPEKILVICLGTGVTAGTCFADPSVKHVTTVEIAESVKKHLPLFYSWNGLEKIASDSERFRIIIDDGRSYVTNADEKFDIITSEPLHPKRAGTVNLYSREYYLHCKQRLNEGGIVAQWLPYHAMTLEEFRAIIKTFSSCFEYSMTWIGEQGVLIGSDKQLTPQISKIYDLMNKPIVEAKVSRGGYNPELFIAGFWMNNSGMRNYTGEDILPLTDDFPWIEYSLDGADHNVFARFIEHQQPLNELFSESCQISEDLELARRENIKYLQFRETQFDSDEHKKSMAIAELLRSRFLKSHFLNLIQNSINEQPEK